MYNTIHNPRSWEHMENISCYNHNYYRNPQTGEIILEVCDELCNCGNFYIVDENLRIGDCLGSYCLDDYDWDQEEDITLENCI